MNSRISIQRVFTAALLTASAFLAAPARAADAPEVTDEQVVNAMKKGVDYLLKARNAEHNWEPTPDKREEGGHSAIAVYALLHAGDSLQDVTDYHSKLHWRSAEMTPSVKWLSNFEPEATYVAGLQASALALLPKLEQEKRNEGTHLGLDNCRMYLLGSMGPEGGYTYEGRKKDKFEKAWKTYFAAPKAAKANPKSAERDALNDICYSLYNTFGGPELEIQRLIADLREKKASKDPRESAAAAAELIDLENYYKTMPKNDEDQKVVTWRKQIAGWEAEKRDPKNRNNAEKQASLDKTIAEYKTYIDTAKFKPYGDDSNGQYGLLGVWALADWGIEIPNRYWQAEDNFWRHMQKSNGAFVYYCPSAPNEDEDHPALVPAGIASLYVCQEFLDTDLRLTNKPDKHIDAGLAWLNQNFVPNTDGYYMYGIERVGLASGLKFFGTRNWYKEVAALMVKSQAPDGSWAGGHGPIVNTSYTLLFLARGRNPVVFNKLEYKGNTWNARPRDDAYVTRWISKHYEKPVNWQVVNLQVPVDEWLDAPILLITGSQDPRFTKEDVDKLRDFINAGGMIFSTSDGASASFTTAIKKYANEVVGKKYEMRQLPKDHPLFSKELGVDLPAPPPLLGISNGVREVWVHSPQDIGADWQTRKYSTKSFELGAALYFYASGQSSLRSKLQPLAVAADNAPAARTVNVARIDYNGNPDPEPGAWQRLAKLAKANFKTDIQLSTVKFSELDPKKFPLAHLTGTTRMAFQNEDAVQLRNYLDNGGLLFADVAGGGADFAASCKELLKKVYPDANLESLPPDHPVYTGSMPDGVKIDEIDFRRYGEMKLQRRVRTPALKALNVNGKLKVIYSDWDVASGFLGTTTWGILGYGHATSEKIGRNLVLFAANPAAPAPTPSASSGSTEK